MAGERQSGIAEARAVECEQHGRAVTNVTRGADTQLSLREKCSDRKEIAPRTQNSATHAWTYSSSANNNNKSNWYYVLPVFAYRIVTNAPCMPF